MRENEQKIREMFERIQIYSEFSPEPIKITEYKWNKSMTDFEVIYFLGNVKYVFRYNDQIASEIVGDFLKNPLEQLEKEVLYIKRMKERGIGAKEYFPFTEIELSTRESNCFIFASIGASRTVPAVQNRGYV
jgi:hypothetical protein